MEMVDNEQRDAGLHTCLCILAPPYTAIQRTLGPSSAMDRYSCKHSSRVGDMMMACGLWVLLRDVALGLTTQRSMLVLHNVRYKSCDRQYSRKELRRKRIVNTKTCPLGNYCQFVIGLLPSLLERNARVMYLDRLVCLPGSVTQKPSLRLT